MARSSRAAVAEKRHAVLEVAARLFRERGVEAVSVAEVMAAAGLTHGGFYGHFESKEALAAEACSAAFDRSRIRWETLARRQAGEGLDILLGHYLSAAHRDSPGSGCAAPSFAAEAARDVPGGALRRAYAAGIHELSEMVEGLLPSSVKRRRRERALLAMAAMIGAVSVARAIGAIRFRTRSWRRSGANSRPRPSSREAPCPSLRGAAFIGMNHDGATRPCPAPISASMARACGTP